jgi:membrane protease YdiL (CAAX protease family)
MRGKRSLLLLICYGFAATLAVFYGLVERQSLFVTFVAFHLLVCLGIPLLHGWREGSLRAQWQKAWATPDREGAAYGAAFGLALLTGVVSGFWLLFEAGVQPEWIRLILERWGLTSEWFGWFALYIVVVNSLLEELLWRGFVLQRMLRSLCRWAAVLISSFFYALYHLIIAAALFGWRWGIVITLLVFATGVLWGWIKGRYTAVYATWISHLLADLGIALALLLWVY